MSIGNLVQVAKNLESLCSCRQHGDATMSAPMSASMRAIADLADLLVDLCKEESPDL